eukprot:TRINITY_DN12842_c0_g1_i21.p2 TRINITY_DN12842_c0_g1~~TRINITY_DN12842_c0_g1_i21.p2  ORF type:complete len:139 (+),score=50.25 TRINITY_DN12842_c0_g1_i21:475-891(+)
MDQQIHAPVRTDPKHEEDTKAGEKVSQEESESFTGRWTKEEHKRFLEGLRLYGKNWKKVQAHVRTRSTTQVRSHAQKHFIRLETRGEEEERADARSGEENEAGEVQSSGNSYQPPERVKCKVIGPYSPGKRFIRCKAD